MCRLNLTFGGLDFSVLPAFLLLSFATNAVASLGAEVRLTDWDLWGGGRCTHVMHGRSRVTINPGIPTLPGRIRSGCHRPGRHWLAPSAKRREVLDESHEGRAASCYDPLVRWTFLHVDDAVELSKFFFSSGL